MNAAVLAGGRGRRLGGVNKASVQIADGLHLIDAITARLRRTGMFDRILIVGDGGLMVQGTIAVADDERYSDYGVVGGLLTALTVSDAEWNFVCGCDMPFIQPALIELLAENRGGYEAVVPRWGDYIEPLCSFYKRSLIHNRGIIGHRRLSGVIRSIKTRFITEESLRRVDAELLSFFNINTEADIRQARMLWRERESLLSGG